jgi:hypothetical protein
MAGWKARDTGEIHVETLSCISRTNAQPFPLKRVHRLAGFGFRNAFGAESQKQSWNPSGLFITEIGTSQPTLKNPPG